MSASSLPLRLIDSRRAAMTPRTKLLPVRLVNTFSPCDSRSSTTIFVVVVLPLVPEMTTTPFGSLDRQSWTKPESIFSTTKPGSADPSPLSRAMRRTDLPMMIEDFFVIQLIISGYGLNRAAQVYYKHYDDQ